MKGILGAPNLINIDRWINEAQVGENIVDIMMITAMVITKIEENGQ